jgi:hypothetical protein
LTNLRQNTPGVIWEKRADVSKLLANIDPDDEWAVFEAWEAHLRRVSFEFLL